MIGIHAYQFSKSKINLFKLLSIVIFVFTNSYETPFPIFIKIQGWSKPTFFCERLFINFVKCIVKANYCHKIKLKKKDN